MSSIVFKREDNTIAIMYLAEGADKEETVRKFRECHPGEYLEEYYENVEIPLDRSNRDNWKLVGDKIVW